ncbi:MAG: PH domain-containing protein [Patescibacteria group bacterium]
MDRIEIKKTIALVTIKLLFLQLFFALAYLTTSLISDSIDQYNNGTFMSLITYDSLTFVIIALVHLAITSYIFLQWAMEKYIILPDKIRHQWGILLRQTNSWDITNIETGYITEGVVARLFGYGTITFHSPTLETRVVLRDVPSPSLVTNYIEKNLALLGKSPIKYLKADSK